MRLLKDSSGHPSWTLTLSIPISILLTIRFMIGGFTITFQHWSMVLTPWSGADYAMSVALWIGNMAYRNYLTTKPSEPST